MSVTEWVIETYIKNTNKENNLEPAKNFVFVWSLFENMCKRRISNGGTLSFDKFREWVSTLEFQNELIRDPITEMSIECNLVDNIHKSFNHFYQKYDKNPSSFIDNLYNQNSIQVVREKEKFKNFMKDINKKEAEHKIYFMFFITRRIRNKFFHGIKSIGQVSDDHKEFEKSCEYLISIISLIEKY